MKKGFPKCVCAPNCKATANKNQKTHSARKIAVFQMPQKRQKLTPSDIQNDEPTLIVANFNQQQGNTRSIQKQDNDKTSTNEALVYSPLINANLDHQVQIDQMSKNMSNITDHDMKIIGLKIRNGFFNDNTKVTSYVDGFYIGNLVSCLAFPTELCL